MDAIGKGLDSQTNTLGAAVGVVISPGLCWLSVQADSFACLWVDYSQCLLRKSATGPLYTGASSYQISSRSPRSEAGEVANESYVDTVPNLCYAIVYAVHKRWT
ncbi:hypothetical protein [Polaromonas sp. A23]|uniref:hypothetical protein n=1 Tax=Polaromonas sp. A23 TaxID=1944133 RepID=UPI00111574F2|nr:hypothetical protein [Polaromonas sp. A23]